MNKKIYAVDYESPHQDGDADEFNFRSTLMMQRQPLCGRVNRPTVWLANRGKKLADEMRLLSGLPSNLGFG